MPLLIEFVQQNIILVGVFVGLLTLLIVDLLAATQRRYALIEPLAAAALISHQQAVVLDVRERAELNEGQILNARHIPLGELQSRLAELEKFKTKPLLVNCRMGQRSANACALLYKSGFTQVHNLRGGIDAWRGANLPLVKPTPVKK